MKLRARLTALPGLPGWRRAGLDLLAGASIALAQAPFLAWYLAFPGLVWAIYRMAQSQSPAAGWWSGWLVGAGYFAATLNWIVNPFFVEPWVYGWMAPFALLMMAFGLGLFWALASMIAVRFPRRLIALAACLSAVELARGYVLTGFPWAQVGHLWLGAPVEQVAALIGATGLTVITLGAAALAATRRPWGLILSFVLILTGFGFGLWRAAGPLPPDRALTLRLIQPNAEQHLKWDAEQAGRLFRAQLDLTRNDNPADLTIWPETAIPYIFEYSPEVPAMIAGASDGRAVAIGVQRVEGDRGWNSLRVISGGGEVTATYDKHHLVPFGEYMPLGDLVYRWLGVGAFAAQVGNGYSAGPGPAVLDLGPQMGKVLPLICYEAVFPAIPRKVDRPDWILQITNDAWFGTFTGPFQHFQQARLRAIEMGLPLVRVANTGVTAVIDPLGTLRQSLPFGVQAALDVPSLPAALPATPFARWGDLSAVLLLFGLFAAALLPPRRRSA